MSEPMRERGGKGQRLSVRDCQRGRERSRGRERERRERGREGERETRERERDREGGNERTPLHNLTVALIAARYVPVAWLAKP